MAQWQIAGTPTTARDRFLTHVYGIVYANAASGVPLAGAISGAREAKVGPYMTMAGGNGEIPLQVILPGSIMASIPSLTPIPAHLR